MNVPARVPMPLAPAPTIEPALSPTERVAVILSLLEPAQARTIAARFDDAAVERIINAFEGMRAVPKRTLLSTIASFVAELKSSTPTVRGGPTGAADLALAISDPSNDDAASDAAPKEDEVDIDPISKDAPAELIWSHLEKMDPPRLATMLQSDRPAVIAAVLINLAVDPAASLFRALPEDIASAVALHMAQGRPVSSGTMTAITESVRRYATNLNSQSDEPERDDPIPKLTAILNRCPLSRQQSVMSPMEDTAPEHAETVANGLIRFHSLAARLPRSVAPTLFREADEKILYTALRYGMEKSEETTEFLFGNISQRLAEQIRENVTALKMPSDEEGELAQATILGLLLEWEAEDRFDFTEPESPTEE